MMSSGGGSGSTPNTPNSSTLPPPLSPIPFPTAAGGNMRYPLYVQGGPLVYAQHMFPPSIWRTIGPSAQITTTTPLAVNTSSPLTNLTATPIPPGGMVYPIVFPPKLKSGESKKSAEYKRIERVNDYESLAKRPRMSESIPPSPSLTSSPSSHPNTPPHSQNSSEQLLRSSVFEVVYPSQTVIIPPNNRPITGTSRTTSPTVVHLPPGPLPTAVIPVKRSTTEYNKIPQVRPADSAASGSSESGLVPQGRPQPYASMGQLPPPLPDTQQLVLFKCLGTISDSFLNHPNIAVSNQLHELYKQSHYGTSSQDPLSPESACHLTICYLNSLRPGEAISIENLRTMFHYAQAGETDWIQYCKKHKKMSESTYVQSQLMHLSRMAVYPTQGKVQVRTSRNLTEGLVQSLYHLQYSGTGQPEYVVIICLSSSAIIDFCILVVEPVQVLRIREVELTGGLDLKRKRLSKQAPLSQRVSSLSMKVGLSNELRTAVKRFEKSLRGSVQTPFYCTDSRSGEQPSLRAARLSISTAEMLVPGSSHIIEHKPSGPFPEQCNMAVVLLQKMLASFNSDTKIEHFKNIDFRVLCPPDASFVSQTVAEITKNGLVEYIEDTPLTKTTGSPSDHTSDLATSSDYKAEAQRRVLCCNLSSETPRFQSLLNDLHDNKDTLYLIIVENAHLTTRIASRLFPTANKSNAETDRLSLPVSDCLSLLSNTTNCIFLFISSHPYSLQTNHSLIPNQIHWPLIKPNTTEEESKNKFCSLHTFRKVQESTDKGGTDCGVVFREDACFEQLFHKAAAKLIKSTVPSLSIASLRAQLLLEQYVACLLATMGQTPPTSCGLETFALVAQLVNGPMLNKRGQGNMLLIRSHDKTIAYQFYLGLKSVRNSLGLQFRFEIIFDDGSHLLSVSKHFAQRLPQNGCAQAGHMTHYKDLEGIPCMVILAGQARAGLTFPRSLTGVDLRLCYLSMPFSRTAYEYDLSLLNGHYPRVRNGSLFCNKPAWTDTDKEPMKTTPIEETDSVFDTANTHLSPQTTTSNGPIQQRTSSSSSSRKSSFCEDTKPVKTEGGVISYRPMGVSRTRTSHSSASSSESHAGSGNVESSIPKMCGFSSDTGTVTVTIDPPNDDGQFFSSLDLSKTPFSIAPDEDMSEWFGDVPDLESDSDEEEGEEMLNTSKVCLLSRPYYHVWSSQNSLQHLLLPPAQGVTWSGSHKRSPLFDPDPYNQTQYYIKYSKPSSGQDRAHLETVAKETAQGIGKRFLLTGPPQVGKTGTWHLLVRLLHDHLCSSKGVAVETGPPPRSIFLQQDSPSQTTMSNKHSKIVTPDYLATHLCNGVECKEIQSTHQIPSPCFPKPPSVITIGTSPFMAYDVSHSCNECAQLKVFGGKVSDVIVSKVPLKGGSLIPLKWHIPAIQNKHCVLDGDRKHLNSLKLPHINRNKDVKLRVRTPLFIVTMGRDLTGLFNLFHTEYQELVVLVTVESQFDKYCKAWPNHIIMAIPDQEAMGLGSMYHVIKSFAHYNYQLNSQQDGPSHTTWPMVAIMSDNIVMWKKEVEPRSENISMSEALLMLEDSTNCLHYAAISVLTWGEDMVETASLTDFDLCHDFIMLNLNLTESIGYNQFSFNSSDIGFNLKLREAGLRAKLSKNLVIVKKHIPTGGNMYPLHSNISSLCSDIDRVVISLHHDSSSHLPHPGPYLMEHYLLHKSQSLFSHALHPTHPVLVVDNYVTLGPQTHVTMVTSDSLAESSDGASWSSKIQSGSVSIRFGGLLLYLCEGRLDSERINSLSFVHGACLCLVTRDCKTLVQEVARLDLEEKWKFRLKDEYQTACSDKMKPLFFLIGRYEGEP